MVPIPASPEDSDAGPFRDTPVILRASPTDFPGPLQLPGTSPVLLTVRDHDLRDTLYLRVFRNYRPGNENNGIDAKESRNDLINGTVERTVSFETFTWCGGSAGQNITISIVVADEAFDTSGEGDYPFKTPVAGGRWSERNFIVACNQ